MSLVTPHVSKVLPRKAFARTLRSSVVPGVSPAAEGGVPRHLLWLADLAIVTASFVLAYFALPALQRGILASGTLSAEALQWWSVPEPAASAALLLWEEAFWPLLLIAPVVVLSLEAMGAYRPILSHSRTGIVLASVLAPVMGLALVTMVLYAVKSASVSRLFLFSATVLVSAGLLATRSSYYAYRRQGAESGRYAKNVLLVGDMASVRTVSAHLRQHVPATAFRAVGYLLAGRPQPMGEGDDGLPPLLGSASELSNLLISHPVHELIVVQAEASDLDLTALAETCDYFRVTVRIVPAALLTSRLSDLHLSTQSMLGLPEIVLRPRGLDTDEAFIKRAFDVVVSAALLVVLSPIYLAIAVAIKLTTPGLPVFYPWRVIGLKGQPFTGYKFTTMVAEADLMREDLLARNEMSGPVFKIKDDPRITPLGRFLRKYSLNELPQIWSVLKGDMSLVGPRPAFRHELERYEAWQKRKLSVKPGITCLWQVRGRNAIRNFNDWVEMDLEYIENWSLWLDIKIVARTALSVLKGTGS